MAEQKALSNRQMNINIFKGIINNESIQDRAKELMGKEASTFLASCLDLYTGTGLVECDPNLVMAQCMKAAALHLPVTKDLGFCYIIPYKQKGVPIPNFQIGYKGLIQLAQRTGQYKYINADMVFEGETVVNNRITGMVEISGEPTSDRVIGYFAYFQLLNGFEKCIYWDFARVIRHAEKYSQAYKAKKQDSPWFTNFDAMALKTMIKQLIPKYGVMSVEFINAVAMDNEAEVEAEVAQNGNGAPIVIPEEEIKDVKQEEPKEEPPVQEQEDVGIEDTCPF